MGAYDWQNDERKDSQWSVSVTPLDYQNANAIAKNDNTLSTCAARAKVANMPAFCVKNE